MDRELAYLQSLIGKLRATPGGRLPTLRQMAQQSGLSLHRLRRAVGILRLRGELAAAPGKGIVLPGSHADNRRRAERRQGLRQKMYGYLCAAIRQGRHAPGKALPLVKELANTYGASADTVRAVLRQLAHDGWLRRVRRRWIVETHRRARTGGSEISLVGFGLDAGVGLNIPRRARELIRHLDLECNRRNLHLRILGTDALLYLEHASKWRHVRDSLGAVCWVSGVRLPRNRTAFELIRACFEYQPHLAVVDTGGVLPHPGHAVSGLPPVHYYSVGYDEHPGYEAAMHVLQRGHTQAVYVTHERLVPWSLARYRGIRDAFRRCRPVGSCRIVGCRGDERYRSFSAESTRLRRDVVTHLSSLTEWAGPGTLMPYKYDEVNAIAQVREYVTTTQHVRRLQPHFEALLTCLDTTAWICANDTVARLAGEFLSRRGCSVPADRSLIGFDDSPEALHARLSSYHFDLAALAAEIIDAVLRETTRGERGVVQRAGGFVNDRGSVAHMGSLHGRNASH